MQAIMCGAELKEFCIMHSGKGGQHIILSNFPDDEFVHQWARERVGVCVLRALTP